MTKSQAYIILEHMAIMLHRDCTTFQPSKEDLIRALFCGCDALKCCGAQGEKSELEERVRDAYKEG